MSEVNSRCTALQEKYTLEKSVRRGSRAIDFAIVKIRVTNRGTSRSSNTEGSFATSSTRYDSFRSCRTWHGDCVSPVLTGWLSLRMVVEGEGALRSVSWSRISIQNSGRAGSEWTRVNTGVHSKWVIEERTMEGRGN